MLSNHSQSHTAPDKTQMTGTQTLARGLAVLECVANGINEVKNISAKLEISRSTTHRILMSLVSQGYLLHMPYRGYLLGQKLIHLGIVALAQRPLVAIARPYLESLATYTGDTVHLGVEEENQVLYLDKISGTRGLEMRSWVGMRKPIASTGVGKALLLGFSKDRWENFYQTALAEQIASGITPMLPSWEKYRHALEQYAQQGWVYDLEEHEPGVRCIAAPIYDGQNKVVASVSVASADLYMPYERMVELGPEVLKAAHAISCHLGWSISHAIS